MPSRLRHIVAFGSRLLILLQERSLCEIRAQQGEPRFVGEGPLILRQDLSLLILAALHCPEIVLRMLIPVFCVHPISSGCLVTSQRKVALIVGLGILTTGGLHRKCLSIVR